MIQITKYSLRRYPLLISRFNSTFTPLNSPHRNSPFNDNNDDNDSNKKTSFRHSTSPSGLPLSKIFTNSFPLSIKESYEHYRVRHNLEDIQEELIDTCLSSNIDYEIIKTKINKQGDYINELYIAPSVSISSGEPERHLVLIHGYGAGLGFFIKNIEQITKSKPNWHIHAIDLLGYGCSSRPKFPFFKEPIENYTKIEEWFVKSLNSWFLAKGLEGQNTMVLSHSMGAYFSILLNIHNPDLFKKLLLISPAGITHPETPPTIPFWFDKLWNLNVSPFILVRNTAILGSMFTSGWTSRRFSKDTSILSKKEQRAMHLYTYAIFNGKGSGEYMLNYLLGPGGVPRNELINRINKFKCDSTWVYGSNDWMNIEGGYKSQIDLINRGFKCDVMKISDSGHHLYLDNFNDFNRFVIDELNQFENNLK